MSWQHNSDYCDLDATYNENMDNARGAHATAPPASTETPILPQLRISFTGPETLLRNCVTYTITTTLEYVSGSSTKPITLRCESLNCVDFTSYESWLFYHPNTDPEEMVDHFFPDVNDDDDPLPIDIKHGFVTLSPGEKVERDVVIWTNFWKALKVGEEYDLSMHHATIGWWEWGRMEDFAGRKVTKQETRVDRVTLDIPKSNSIRVKVVGEDAM